MIVPVALLLLSLCGISGIQTPPAETVGAIVMLAAGSQVDLGRVQKALQHQDPPIRIAAARLVGAFDIRRLDTDIEAALAREPDDRVGSELLRTLLLLRGPAAVPVVDLHARRLRGDTTLTFARWFARNDPARFAVAMQDFMARLETQDVARFREAVDLAARTLGRPDLLTQYVELVTKAGGTVPDPDPFAGNAIATRSVPAWTEGLFESAAAAAGCRLSDREQFGYVRINYRADARPEKVAVNADPRLSNECTQMLFAVARTTLADDDRPIPREAQWVMVPLTREFARCTAVIERHPKLEKDPKITSFPKKVKDVRPVYPEAAMRNRLQGQVVLQGVISTTGCVSSLRVTRPADMLLDLAALRAAIQWKFTPVTVSGKPVPVVITLTTNFTLQ